MVFSISVLLLFGRSAAYPVKRCAAILAVILRRVESLVGFINETLQIKSGLFSDGHAD